MQGRLTALLVLVLTAAIIGATEDGDIAAAKAAEAAFHQACDKWSSDAGAGIDTAPSAGRIAQTYFDFLKKARATRYRESVNNAVLLPDQIAIAGALDQEDGSKWSYVAGKGQSGLIVSVWKREAWQTDRVPPNGIEASIGIEPTDLLSKFTVGRGSWSSDKQAELRIPYHLGELAGTIRVQRTGGTWKVLPDRGTMGPGNWWKPAVNAPATRPAG
jgi:hypothetical protein